jgi:rare lipoprotein A
MRQLVALAVILVLAGCGSTPRKEDRPGPTSAKGGYYRDDGPGARAPADLDRIPDAVPRVEPLNRFANRPYVQFGKQYVPLTSVQPFRQRGIASWYGKRYHGQKTSVGEIYDMYKMSAAHPTLPIPSYARVTNVRTGRSVVVRVNDRGPFLHGRAIDLSYAAAHRLGYIQQGSAEVDVEAIVVR